MASTYHPYKIALTDEQKKKLQTAFATKSAVTLRVKPEQIGRGDELLFTATQINRMQKAVSKRKGLILKMSQTQFEKNPKGAAAFSLLCIFLCL